MKKYFFALYLSNKRHKAVQKFLTESGVEFEIFSEFGRCVHCPCHKEYLKKKTAEGYAVVQLFSTYKKAIKYGRYQKIFAIVDGSEILWDNSEDIEMHLEGDALEAAFMWGNYEKYNSSRVKRLVKSIEELCWQKERGISYSTIVKDLLDASIILKNLDGEDCTLVIDKQKFFFTKDETKAKEFRRIKGTTFEGRCEDYFVSTFN